jgi:hypothetical protein
MEWVKIIRTPGQYWSKCKWFAWYPVKVEQYCDKNERWKWLCFVIKETNLTYTYYYDLPKGEM